MANKIDISNKNIVLFGCGAVQKNNLHLIEKFFIINPNKMIIIDLIDYRNHPYVKNFIKRGCKYIIENINKEYKNIISKLNKYDIVLDLSNRTDSLKISEECAKNNIHYLNTSIEDTLEPKKIQKTEEELKQTYQYNHNQQYRIKNEYKECASQAVVFGMNPGLITIFTKIAILFMAKNEKTNEILNVYRNERDYAKLCEYLEIEIIHCSETDDTHFENDYDKNKFYNTWCCQAFIDEMSDESQITYGSHNETIPKDSVMLDEHLMNLKQPAYKIYSESFVPNEKFIGIVIPHSEQITASNYYSTDKHCPTVHYVYKFSPLAFDSIKRLPKNKIGGTFNINSTEVVSNYNNKILGTDKVGALIISKNKGTVWCGSILNNKDKDIDLNQATTQQVAIANMAALSYLITNKDKGILFPENIDETFIYNFIKNDIGLFCDYVDYKPKSTQFMDLSRTKKQFDKQYKN